SHRRAPHQRQASGGTQFARIECVEVLVYVTEVDERRNARGGAVDQAREEHLQRAHGLERAADRLQVRAAERGQPRAEGVAGEATHRTHATGVEVREERQAVGGDRLDVVGRVGEARLGGGWARLEHRRSIRIAVVVDRAARGEAQVAAYRVVVVVAVAQLDAGVEHQVAGHRPEPRIVVVELEVLDGRAGQGRLQPDALVGAAGRGQ